MPSTDDITEVLIALTGLIAAIATLVAAFRHIHARIDQTDDFLVNHTHVPESSSPKVLPPNNSD